MTDHSQITAPRARLSHPAAPTLSDEEIVRRLRAIRHSGGTERYARRAPTLNAIARASGLSRQTIYALTTTGKGIGPRARQALSQALMATCQESEGARSGGCLHYSEPGGRR